MSEGKSPLSHTLQLLGRAVEDAMDEHPGPARLLAYHRGELAPEEAAAVQEHLAWCREDAALLLELVETFEEEVEGAADEEEEAAAWQRLRRTLPEMPSAAAPTPSSHSPWFWSVAASLLVVGFTAGWAVVEHQRRLAGERPRVNVPIQDVAPPASERAAGEAPVEVTLAPEEDRVILILNPSAVPAPGRYRLRILDAGGRPVFATESLQPTRFGNFTLELTRGFLVPGRYRIEIYTADGRTVLDRYPLRFADEPQPGLR